MIITINRPAARNAINRDVAIGMAQALDRLDAEDDLRVGIVNRIAEPETALDAALELAHGVAPNGSLL